jgi:hypothetical protein
MKEQYENALNYLKDLNIKACITGSCMLEYNEEWHQDIDIFAFNDKSFAKLYYTLRLNPKFTILDKLELWKANSFEERDFNNKGFGGVTTIKLMYNLCIPINIILKKNCTNVFSVLSSFDLNIICKAFDLESKQYLDLTGDSQVTKIADINKWNVSYQSNEIWAISRILRQLERCVKYHRRGYNTDAVVLKYIDIINNLEEYQSIFSSEDFNEKLKVLKENTAILKQILEKWLEDHKLTEEELTLLQQKIKEL